MNTFHSFFVILGILVFISCGANKAAEAKRMADSITNVQKQKQLADSIAAVNAAIAAEKAKHTADSTKVADSLAMIIAKKKVKPKPRLRPIPPKPIPLRPVKKPVLYLYPTEKQEVIVKIALDNNKMIHPYPAYEEGWEVIASPDGNLINKKTGKSHYCLFWEMEGTPFMQTLPTGFVVKGEETAVFLEEKLAELGLNEKEANEFIIFWLPQMEDNAYNLIHFAQNEYEAVSKLIIQPKPETLIRVMMLWQPLSQKRQIMPQILPIKPIRKGFTAVEWGGAVFEPAF